MPYVVGAKHRDSTRALKALPEPDREYLLARLGQAISGHTSPDDKVVFLDGVGGNGESSLLDPVRLALGTYAGMVPQQLLLAKAGDHPVELMTLRGVRFAWVEELPEAGRLNTQRLKTVMGTGAITARALYKDFVTFEPSHSLFITTNHLPFVAETDHGTRRRLDRVPFRRKFRHDTTVDALGETLRERVRTDRLVWRAARWSSMRTPGTPTARRCRARRRACGRQLRSGAAVVTTSRRTSQSACTPRPARS